MWMIPVLADICCEVSDAHARASKSVQTLDAKGHWLPSRSLSVCMCAFASI